MIDDKACREVLRNKIANIQKDHPKKYAKELGFIMAQNFNVKYGMTAGIFNDPAIFDTMSYDMMYKLMVSLKELLKDYSIEIDSTDLNVDYYFTDAEKTMYSIPLEEKENDFDIVIKEWHRQKEGQYDIITIFTNIDEVIKWRDYNKLRFNPETQRDLITVKTKGVPIKKLDINNNSISKMKELMLKGIYFPVTGHININPEFSEETIYFSNGDLIIPQKAKIDLIEGFHNYIAETQVKDENPDWEYPVKFELLFLNTERANEFINQMDTKNHLKAAQKAKIDTGSQANYIINELNVSSKFHLRGTINKNNFLYLYNLINKIYNVKDRKPAVDLLKCLQTNTNYMISETDHYEIPLNKKEWFVVLYLTKKCIDNNVEFDVIFDKIGFNSLIGEIDIINSPLRKHYKIIDKAFEEVIK